MSTTSVAPTATWPSAARHDAVTDSASNALTIAEDFVHDLSQLIDSNFAPSGVAGAQKVAYDDIGRLTRTIECVKLDIDLLTQCVDSLVAIRDAAALEEHLT